MTWRILYDLCVESPDHESDLSVLAKDGIQSLILVVRVTKSWDEAERS